MAAVVDLFSRRVVGWSMSATMTAQLVTDALVMAIWRRGKPRALLHHSNRGSLYTSEQFQRLIADHGVTCSMSRSGNCWDNTAMESFFSSLKTERTARKTYRTRDDARADVFDYPSVMAIKRLGLQLYSLINGELTFSRSTVRRRRSGTSGTAALGLSTATRSPHL